MWTAQAKPAYAVDPVPPRFGARVKINQAPRRALEPSRNRMGNGLRQTSSCDARMHELQATELHHEQEQEQQPRTN